MDAGASARQRIERLRRQEAELVAKLDRTRRDIAAWEAGLIGEERIATLLEQLPEGWQVLHDRRKSPRSPANIDHIVVGPNGVHVIDAKNWSGRLWIGHKGVICGRTPRGDEMRTVAGIRDALSAELQSRGFGVPVFGAVALASDEPTSEMVIHDGVAIIPASRLIDTLTEPSPVLSPVVASRVADLVDELHPPRIKGAVSRLEPPLPTVRRRPARPVPVAGRRSASKGGGMPPWLAGAVALVAAVIALSGLKSIGEHVATTQPQAPSTHDSHR